jgi:ABC-2 type transport system permease protein
MSAVSRIGTIARREYLAIARRKAFVFTAIGMPLYFGFVMWMAVKPQISGRREAMDSLRVISVVDSSGLYANASRLIRTDLTFDFNPFTRSKKPPRTERFETEVRFFPDQPAAERALRAGEVNQVVVVPAEYLRNGGIRRYARSSNLLSSGEERPLANWLVRNLLGGKVDSLTAERVSQPLDRAGLYTLNRDGGFDYNDKRREVLDFLLPFSFAMLLGLCIVIGGQYLLQGVTEEKESRILESLLCTVSSEELLAGKLIGLGGAGLTLVAFWSGAGAFFGGPAAAMTNVHFSPVLLIAMIGYLLLGYLFYGSLMTGIGAVTNNMREAQQFAFMFTFANWAPFIMLTAILQHPDRNPALGLSLFPPTAPVTMMLRLTAPGSVVPGWQLLLSMGLLAGSAILALIGSARVFRIGLLMYGKTPNLPEILRWARSG